MISISLPEAAARVIAELEARGHEAYAVGGCVRDALLGREASDWDVATSALPSVTLEIFESLPDLRAVPTGLRHGTVTVICGGEHVEVTTYRIDGEYTDRRRPDSVAFTASLTEDLARRDFTVNAMAYSKTRGLIDPYGGADDLRRGCIRCVGDPKRRFAEDALRILRALRFASVLGFYVDGPTAEAARSQCSSLSHVSRERVFAELAKLLSAKGAATVIRDFLPIITEILPSARLSDTDKLCGSIERIGEGDLPLMLAALLADTPAESVRDILRTLRADNKTVSRAVTVVSHLGCEVTDELSLKQLCRELGYDAASDVLRLGIARDEVSPSLLGMLEDMRRRGECVAVGELAVGGHELLSLGAAPREIGKILDMLLDAVIRGEIKNDGAALCKAAKRFITERNR